MQKAWNESNRSVTSYVRRQAAGFHEQVILWLSKQGKFLIHELNSYKLFSISSEDLYILKNDEYKFLFIRPAYDEWIQAKCPNTLSKEEQEDLEKWHAYYFPNSALFHEDNKSFFEKSPFSKGYTDYLRKKNKKHDDCVKKIRWDHFVKTVIKYNE